MPEVHIATEARSEFGKGAARRSRRAGRVPAVLYGHGTETRHLSLPAHDLMLALKTPNALLRLEGLKSGSAIALPKAVQRDPVRNEIEHVDLILVRRGEKVTVEVPIRVTGEIFSGGLLDQQLVQIPVEAEATQHSAGNRRRRGGHAGREVGARPRPGAAERRDPAGRTRDPGPARGLAAAGRGRGRGRGGAPRCRRRWPGRPARPVKGSRQADRGPLDHRRPGQPGTGVRGQQAQRRPHGHRAAGGASVRPSRPLQGASVRQRHRRGNARRDAGHLGLAAFVHEPVRRAGFRPARVLQAFIRTAGGYP